MEQASEFGGSAPKVLTTNGNRQFPELQQLMILNMPQMDVRSVQDTNYQSQIDWIYIILTWLTSGIPPKTMLMNHQISQIIVTKKFGGNAQPARTNGRLQSTIELQKNPEDAVLVRRLVLIRLNPHSTMSWK